MHKTATLSIGGYAQALGHVSREELMSKETLKTRINDPSLVDKKRESNFTFQNETPMPETCSYRFDEQHNL